jgi:FMN reductase
MDFPLHIVGIGGTVRPGSSSEQALRVAMRRAQASGATTRMFTGPELAQLPMYAPDMVGSGGPVAAEFVAELRRADGVVVASPGYHGSLSGLVKNALDYVEEMRADTRPYLSDRSVGLIVAAYGWQAGVTTLSTLRTIVHALRAWPTPYGAVVNSAQCGFPDGQCSDQRVTEQLELVADEVVRMARLTSAMHGAALLGAAGGVR